MSPDVLTSDEFARVFQEQNQDFERLPGEPDPVAVLANLPGLQIYFKGTKPKLRWCSTIRRVAGFAIRKINAQILAHLLHPDCQKSPIQLSRHKWM